MARVYAATGEIEKGTGCYERILKMDIDRGLAEAARTRLQDLRSSTHESKEPRNA